MRRYTLKVKDKDYIIDVQELAAERFWVRVGGDEYEVYLSAHQDLAGSAITPQITPVKTARDEAIVERPAAAYQPPAPETLRPLPAAPMPALPSAEGLRAELRAPMPGTILSVEVKPGDRVARGQVALVLEAMKMKNALKSPQDATVAEILVQPGQTVAHNQILLRFESKEA